ncbi:MAG: ATP-binding protein [Planctomycetota bacterium]
MSTPTPLIMCWSGGKDSALALDALQHDPAYEVVGLLTTLSREFDRISHHGVRSELLDLQAQRIGLPLTKIHLDTTLADCTTMDQYETLMAQTMRDFYGQGVRAVGYGDINLRDLRDYREKRLDEVGMIGVFPLWERDTAELADDFIQRGFGTRLSCIDATKLDPSFAGRLYDDKLLDDFPHGVDPCGENGEFHSFCFDGPIYGGRPIPIEVGDILDRDTRTFADLLLAEEAACGS